MGHHNGAFIGIDTSKLRNAIAVAEEGRGGDVRFLGEIDTTEAATRKLVAKLATKYRQLTFCYEAGPTGYGLYRLIRKLGHDCIVVAPSLIPKKPGDRVKTNRRDAMGLAKLSRAGELTAVWVPDERHEAMRDLARAREAAQKDLRGKRQQVLVFHVAPQQRHDVVEQDQVDGVAHVLGDDALDRGLSFRRVQWRKVHDVLVTQSVKASRLIAEPSSIIEEPLFVPVARDGSWFSPTDQHKRDGQYYVSNGSDEETFNDYELALDFLTRAASPRWRYTDTLGRWRSRTAIGWERKRRDEVMSVSTEVKQKPTKHVWRKA